MVRLLYCDPDATSSSCKNNLSIKRRVWLHTFEVYIDPIVWSLVQHTSDKWRWRWR
uniref:Uncharacterized protein n=1 Tax=Rhizophora mucronata TaxID=61149 RepID=A0A2P2PPD8_RHIMU